MGVNFRSRLASAFRALARRDEGVTLVLALAVVFAGLAIQLRHPTGQIKIVGTSITVVVLASVSLRKRSVAVLLAAVAVCVGVIWTVQSQHNPVTVSAVVTILAACGVAWVQAVRRDRLGLHTISAEGVLELIRDRLQVQAQLPDVPPGWSIDVEQRAADRAAISGDFVASRLVGEGRDQLLHLVLVDVSGSGIAAGPPALLLSGAVGGLLGAVAPDDFLGAANDYLTRQEWSLGFASASYITLEMATGRYEIRVAGHPPAMHYRASQANWSARWRESTASGTLLGVLPTLAGVSDAAVLEPGDALIAYTDGVVEDRVRDFDSGVVRLQSVAEAIAESGDWTHAAADLIERVPVEVTDDRTVVVIRRSPKPTVTQARNRVQDASPARSGSSRSAA